MARILVIDDEELIRMTVVQTLEGAGHTVVEAVDGDDGVKKFREAPADLVITDILMPNKEGIETITELRGIQPDLLIIAMSGGGRQKNTSFLDIAEKMGAAAVLKKPFRIDELQQTVDNLLRNPGRAE